MTAARRTAPLVILPPGAAKVMASTPKVAPSPAIPTQPALTPQPSGPAGPQEPEPLSEEEREMDKFIGVPRKGLVPTLIDWNEIPVDHMPAREPNYQDYAHPGAPEGMLQMLRDAYALNRMEKEIQPVNVLVIGPKGTGKTSVVRRFSEETGLPYWGVQGESTPSWMLLGRTELENGHTIYRPGIIPQAVKTGGILHFDEMNVFDPEVLMRLDELLDNRRQLNMVNETGEVIKAHPDLFIIATMNPPTYEGVKELPDPIKSRFGLVVQMNPPTANDEMKALQTKFDMSDKQFAKYKPDVAAFIKAAQELREDQSLSYTPTMRESVSFLQQIVANASFKDAAVRALFGKYYTDEEKNRVAEALIKAGHNEFSTLKR